MDLLKNIYDFFGNKYTYLVMGFIYGFIISSFISSLYVFNDTYSIVIGLFVGIMVAIFMTLFHLMLTDIVKWADAKIFLSTFGMFLFFVIIFVLLPLLLSNVKNAARFIGDVYDAQEHSVMNTLRELMPQDVMGKFCRKTN